MFFYRKNFAIRETRGEGYYWLCVKMPEEKWQFSSLGELHQAANEALRQAMIHERSKKWSKVSVSSHL